MSYQYQSPVIPRIPWEVFGKPEVQRHAGPSQPSRSSELSHCHCHSLQSDNHLAKQIEQLNQLNMLVCHSLTYCCWFAMSATYITDIWPLAPSSNLPQSVVSLASQ